MNRAEPAAKHPLSTHLVLGGLTLSALLLAAVRLDLYRSVMQEDGWAEWLTFLLFLSCGLIAARGALQSSSKRAERLALAGLAAFGFFVAGEEISWGQRLLAFQPPEIFLEKNYQQESNLHNLLQDIVASRWIVLCIAALYGIAAPLAARAVPRWSVLAPRLELAPYFAVVVALEAFYPWELAGELAELLLGAALLRDVLDRAPLAPGARGEDLALWLQSAAIVVALLLVPLVDAVTAIDATRGTMEARSDLERLRSDLERPRALRSKSWKKRRIHKRIFTAVRAKYLRFAADGNYLAAGDEPWRPYFLDPWKQPYWIAQQRVGKNRVRVLLYSFGANRRRDSRIGALAIGGDDVGVSFEIERSPPRVTAR